MLPLVKRISLFLLFLSSATAALPRLILDTDIGTDFDDAWAMHYLLSRSIPSDPTRSFDFQLVQCSTFNTTNRARIAAKILYDLKRFDVAVGVGVYTGEDAMNELPVVGDFELSDFVAAGGTVFTGTDHLASLLASGTPTDPIFAVEIAPATSLGDVVKTTPALSRNTLLSAMSGSVYHGYGNSTFPEKEYNVYIDIPASQAMYAAQWLSPMLMTPLDTSALLRCTAPEFSDLIAANNSDHPYAQVLLKNYDVWSHGVPNNSSVSDILYDAQAAVSMLYYSQQWVLGDTTPPTIPSLVIQTLPISVNSSGFTVIDPSARTVFSSTSFANGLVNATHTICKILIDSIIAAK